MNTIELPASVRDRSCFTQYMTGGLAVDAMFFEEVAQAIKGVGMPAIWAANDKAGPTSIFSTRVFSIAAALKIAGDEVQLATSSEKVASDEEGVPPYVIANGTAIIPVAGPLSKQPSSLQSMFGGSSTVGMRKALGLAMADSRVQRILFHIDSPGGTVSGTGDLGDDIFAASTKKPVASFIEDMGTSAAYWIASQTGAIYASPYAHVGSIGVIWPVYDTSEAAAKQGVKVHAITSSPGKAFSVDGMPITKQQLVKMQAHVDSAFNAFLGVVARGRSVTTEQALAMSGDADIYDAKVAEQKNLIDAVGTFREALIDFAAHGKLRLSPVIMNGNTTSSTLMITTSTGVAPSLSTSFTIDGNMLIPSPLIAAQSGDGTTNTPVLLPSDKVSSMTPNPENPAAKPVADPNVTMSAEDHKALTAKANEGSEALKIVKAMQTAQANASASALAAARDAAMADYNCTKEQVDACSDVSSLNALVSYARTAKAQRSGADPKASGSAEKSPEDLAATEIQEWNQFHAARHAAVNGKPLEA